MVVDDGADLCIRGVDDDHSSLNPEFLIEPPVLVRVVFERLIEPVPVGGLENTRREVGILAVLEKE